MAKQDETILIALDYLLNFTDEDHLSNATEINNYALDTYGIPVDHRCVNKFLARLKELCDKYPDKFPFILESNGNERPRYYLEQKYFSKEDIISIASAIKDTFQLDEVTSNELVNKFVDVTSNVNQKQEIMDILSSEPKKGGKIKQTTANVLKKIELAIKEKREITYCYKYSQNPQQHTDYFYKVFYLGQEPTAIIIRDGKLVSEYVKNIRIIRLEEPWYDDPRCTFKISDRYEGEYENPDEEIKDVIVPVADTILTRLCSFTFKNTAYAVDTIKTSFEEYFHKPLTYLTGGGRCFAQIKIKGDIFLDWAVQHEVSKLITVTGDEEILKGLEIHYKELIHRNNLNKYQIKWKDDNGRNNNR